MENQFTHVMARKSDVDLLQVAEERHRYEPEAYVAAIAELERRQLLTPELRKKISTQKASTDVPGIMEEQLAKKRGSWKDTLTLFKVSKDYFYTPIIIYINVGTWVLMVVTGVHAFEPSVDSLVEWGGNLSFMTLDGQPWRLLMSTFLHGGIFHLLLNMYALLQVGAILEIHFGKHRYALIYLVAGIFASLASAAFSENVVSVGASGAIFGLYGLLVSLLITKSLQISLEERKALTASTLTFIGYNVLYGFSKEGIDNAAHIGGLFSGFILGLVYYPIFTQQKKSAVVSIALVAVTLIAVWAAPSVISNAYSKYNAMIEPFASREQAAMWMYKGTFPVAGTDEAKQFSERLKTEGIDLWNENLTLLGTLTDLPTELQERVDLLKKYCELRIEACEAMQLLMESNNVEEMASLEEVNRQIDELLDSLGAMN